MMYRLLIAAVALAGCVADDVPDPGQPDAGVDGAGDCPAPIAAPTWLDTYLGEHVARLAASPRSTDPQRSSARSYLMGQLSALGLTVSLDSYGQGANVVGELAATDAAATEWILVGAHFDTVDGSPGANDNASGVAVALAVARAITEVPCRARGLKVVMFDQEEIGLVGSTTYATRALQERTSLVAVHTVDQVGWDSDGDQRFEIELPTNALFAEYQAGATAIGVQVVRTMTSGTDHTAFRERGFDAAGVSEEYVGGDTTPHYHEPTDTADTVKRSYHVLAARLVTYVVARELGAD